MTGKSPFSSLQFFAITRSHKSLVAINIPETSAAAFLLLLVMPTSVVRDYYL